MPDGPDYVLPKEELARYLAHENELEIGPALFDNFQPDHCFIYPIHNNQYHPPLMRKLARDVFGMVEEMMEEVKYQGTAVLGTETSWTQRSVFVSVERLTAGAASAAVVGKELARDKNYIDNLIRWGNVTFIAGTITRAFPGLLRPIVGLLAILPSRYYFKKFAACLRPEMNKKLAELQKACEAGVEMDTANANVLEGHLIEALSRKDPRELHPGLTAYRIIFFSTSAFQTMSAAATHLMFDLYSADPALGIVETLRSEIEAALRLTNGRWTAQALRAMPRLESTIRESMRLSAFSTRGCSRKVVSRDGYTTSKGDFIPYGGTISIPQWSIQHDDAVYQEALSFKPFRFYNEKDDTCVSLATTSENFLPFGHGKHACPGRFYAAVTLKLVLAFVVMNYDVMPLTERPTGHWLGTNHVPPLKASLTIRRRMAA
ncbi:hypothetical protein E8E14_003368 [Neopestalotiopsis sp. 37M]|nr:hypothetical protein E8E14_003368 [Neopestalotiopsis sp. 37M]